MEDSGVFEMLARCFAPMDECDWNETVATPRWQDFIRSLRRLLQDEHGLGESQRPVWSLTSVRPFQEFLTESEIDALFTPPSMNGSDALPESPEFVARELGSVADMLKTGRRREARRYLIESFTWLTDYRRRLLDDADAHRFHIALTDVILGIREQQIQITEAA